MRVLLLCLAFILCAASYAHAQEAPRTLAGFRLGMSVEEARAAAPSARWPRAEPLSFHVNAPLVLDDGRFSLDLLFVRGVLERMSVDAPFPQVSDSSICLRALDAIVKDLEVQVGPLDNAAVDGESSGVQIGATQTPLGSQVRHYHNESAGTFIGVAHAAHGQKVEARVLIMPVRRNTFGCIFLLNVVPIPVPPPRAAILDDGTPRLEGVVWLERPTGDDFARVYPPVAEQGMRNGDVILDCRVRQGGLLDCAVASETPAGWDFGAAAMSLSRSFRAGPQTRDGVATEGGRVVVTIGFRLS